jgi:hypothetical protein
MRAYSMDLRERVLAAVDRATPRKEIVRTLGVSEPTIRRYLRLRRETGSVARRFAILRTFHPQARRSDLTFLLYVRRALAAYPGVLEVPKVVLALPETPTRLLSG